MRQYTPIFLALCFFPPVRQRQILFPDILKVKRIERMRPKYQLQSRQPGTEQSEQSLFDCFLTAKREAAPLLQEK